MGVVCLRFVIRSRCERGTQHFETGGTRPLGHNAGGCAKRAPRSHRALARVECHDYLNRLEHTRRIYCNNEEEARAIADSILCSAPHVHNGQ